MCRLDFQFADDFQEESVILVSLDEEGVALLISILENFEQNVKTIECIDESNNKLVIEPSENMYSEIKILQKNKTLWKIPRVKASESLNILRGMMATSRPCHNYLTIDTPTKTLVFSKNE